MPACTYVCEKYHEEFQYSRLPFLPSDWVPPEFSAHIENVAVVSHLISLHIQHVDINGREVRTTEMVRTQ
jgi:hypothetical protein